MKVQKKVPAQTEHQKKIYNCSNTSNHNTTKPNTHFKLNDVILVMTLLGSVMRYGVFSLLLLVTASASCADYFAPPTTSSIISDVTVTKDGLVIAVMADVSASFDSGSFPKVTVKHLEEIIHYIDQEGGKLYLGIVGARSLEQLLLYSNETVKKKMPIQRASETSNEYFQRLMTYKKSLKRKAYAKDQDQLRKEFLAKAKKLLVYNSLQLHNKSQVCTSFNLVQKIFSETIHKDRHHIAIFVSDGWNNDGKRCARKLPSTTKLVVVNKLPNDGVFHRYKREKFTLVESALEYVLSNY